MAATYIPNQPIKFFDDFETAKLECECVSHPYCLTNINGQDLPFILELDSAETQLLDNNEFDDGLTDWTQTAVGDNTWIDTTCDTEFVISSSGQTEYIYQTFDVEAGQCYRVCIQLCGELTSDPNCKLQVAINNATASDAWVVLDESFAVNINDEQCVTLDLSAYSAGTYTIGLRGEGAMCGLNWDVEQFSLYKSTCSVEVKDCECDDVEATLVAENFDADTNQYLFIFNADTLGLSEGQYRISADGLGCSSCIEVVPATNISCYPIFKAASNSDGVFGFTWSLFSANDGFLLTAKAFDLRYAGYVDEESVIYQDSAYKNKLPYFKKRKKYTLVLDHHPEYVHDFLAILCSGSEYFSISIDGNEKRYRIAPESYEPSWSKESDLASVKIELWEYQGDETMNSNASNMD